MTRMGLVLVRAGLLLLALAAPVDVIPAEDRTLDHFRRVPLADVYFSEGAGAGDINGDGHADVVYGPYWFSGPEFREKHEIYPPKPQPMEAYADHFFAWVYDFNCDGANDVFTVGFPGTPAYVYENPTKHHLDQHWKKHQVIDEVSNESPQFVNLVGDERPELVCTRDGFFGYATVDWDKPFEAWTFHAVSDKTAPARFGHGLGVGDVNGDGRNDILFAGGWLEQPAPDSQQPRWTLHSAAFTNAYGGAEMYAYDVDGDGDNDIITSLAAHDFGLAWYEQDRSGAEPVFRQHLIMGDRPEQNRYGLVFSEPHSVNLADIDGDGLKDIITGKTYYSHHKASPLWDAGAVVYWFKLVRNKDGVDWIPYRADDQAGIGRQVVVHDMNGDDIPDIVVGGMKGSHVLLHTREKVDEERWRAAQPQVVEGAASQSIRGKPAPLDEQTGRVVGALEGEALKVLRASAGRTSTQNMSGFKKDRWSGGQQVFWTGAKPGDRLELELPVEQAGAYQLATVFTMARDFAIVRLYLDDKPLGEPIDLYNYPDVITSGVLEWGQHELSAGPHRLAIDVVGANGSAIPAYMVGLDCVRLLP